MGLDLSKIHGNDHLKRIFVEYVSDKTLPHALILEGDRGSGRYTFALHVAAAMLCSDITSPCYCCKNCRQIFEGCAPDVVTVSLPEDKATISVDAVRFIRSDAQSVPVEGDYKFYIIRDSEKMTVQAQNALLKILEEPPSFVVFIIICENSNLLLPTIRSRAPVFRMQRFEDAELTEHIVSDNESARRLQERDPEVFLRLIKASGGCIGRVLEGLNKNSFNRVSKDTENITSMLDALCGSDKAKFMSFEDSLSSKRDELKQLLYTVRGAIRDILSVKKGTVTNFVFFDSVEQTQRYTKFLTLAALFGMYEATENILNSNEQNANVNLLKINYMSILWKCAHRKDK